MIIDYIDKLELSEEKAKQHFNEFHSLEYLASGLSFLYKQISKIETKISDVIPKNKRVFIFGNAPPLKGINQELVACAFHWYSVTACNYVKMVGWLAYDGDQKKAKSYLQQVIPPVELWRNKIGAHFAMHSPRSENAADLAMSVMFPLSFNNDAFYTGLLTLSIKTENTQSASLQEMQWSLTHTHRALIQRYWPR